MITGSASEGYPHPALLTDRKTVDAATATTSSTDTVRCRNNDCGKTADVNDARKIFKTCHNCSHVYCSRDCRRAHWEKHRKTCLHSRVGALCRRVLSLIKTDPKSLLHVSMLARRGFLSQGRGTVRCLFTSPESAEDYVNNGLPALKDPSYVQWSDLPANDIGSELYAELLKLCKSYNPDTRFVLYVSICVLSEIPTSGAVKWERQLVSRCAKTKLDKSLITKPSPPLHSKSSEHPETLILTSVPGCPTSQKSRQICFINIQRHLRLHGVSLRRHFPEVYQNLCAYVEGSLERFTPVTIYPRDSNTNKHFMCIIMPDADPEKLEMVPTNSRRVQTIDVSKEIS